MRTKLTALLSLSVLALLPLTSKAQFQSNEIPQNRIKVSYGDASYVAFSTAFFSSLIGGSGEMSTMGSFSAGYRRLTNNSRWALGVDVSYTAVREKFTSGVKLDFSFMSVVPTAEFYYLKSGLCRLYGTAGVGAMISNEKSVGLAFQVSPIALRVGRDKFAGFVELGAGYKGIANVGFEVAF